MVHKLGAAIAEEDPTYFYTHSCSMRTHFGMKILWDWITGTDILLLLNGGIYPDDVTKKRLEESIVDSAGVLILRAWMEMVIIWTLYITKSPEKPIGEVTKHINRLELQDMMALANLPHVHSIFWTNHDLSTPDGMEEALDHIRGFVLDLIRPDERQKYIDEGLFPNDEAVVRFVDMVSKFLGHNHDRRCFVRANTKDNPSDTPRYKCKATDNYLFNPSPSEHTIAPIAINHSQSALEVFSKLEMADLSGPVPVYFSKCLLSKKHYPPAHGNEGIISPVFGVLSRVLAQPLGLELLSHVLALASASLASLGPAISHNVITFNLSLFFFSKKNIT